MHNSVHCGCCLAATPSRDGYNGGGGGRPGPRPPAPPLVTKKVTTFGHKKRDPNLAILGSPLPVHAWEGGDDATLDTQHI